MSYFFVDPRFMFWRQLMMRQALMSGGGGRYSDSDSSDSDDDYRRRRRGRRGRSREREREAEQARERAAATERARLRAENEARQAHEQRRAAERAAEQEATRRRAAERQAREQANRRQAAEQAARQEAEARRRIEEAAAAAEEEARREAAARAAADEQERRRAEEAEAERERQAGLVDVPGQLRRYRWADLERAFGHPFEADRAVSTTASSNVFKVDIDGKPCMVKIVESTPLGQEVGVTRDQLMALFGVEVHTLARFRHRNVVPIHGFAIDGRRLALVTHRCELGDLRQHLESGAPFSASERLAVLQGIASGVAYLHMGTAAGGGDGAGAGAGAGGEAPAPVALRDVKSTNVGLEYEPGTSNLRSRLFDLGTSKSLANRSSFTRYVTQFSSGALGTPGYMAPEVEAGAYSLATDVYSLGVIAAELLTGEPPVPPPGAASRLILIRRFLSDCKPLERRVLALWPKPVAAAVDALIRDACQEDQFRRPTARTVLARIVLIRQQLEAKAMAPARVLPPNERLNRVVAAGALTAGDEVPVPEAAVCVICDCGDTALACPAGHAMCQDCLGQYVSVTLGDAARLRGDNNMVRCPAPDCQLQLDEATVVRCLPTTAAAAFLSFLLPLLRHTEQQRAAATAARRAVRREAGRVLVHQPGGGGGGGGGRAAGRAAGRGAIGGGGAVGLAPDVVRDDAAPWMDLVKVHEDVAKLLTLECPHCSTTFHDYDGCAAVTCSACGGSFCGCCLESCYDDDDAHRHVANAHSSLWPPQAEREAGLKAVRLRRLRRYFRDEVPAASRADAVASVAALLLPTIRPDEVM